MMSSFEEELCGESFNIWNGHYFSRCFVQLVLVWFPHVVLAVLSSFYIGYGGHTICRSSRHLHFIHTRIFITSVLCVCSLVNIIGLNIVSVSPFSIVDYLAIYTTSFCWLLHIGYLINLKKGITRGIRGPFFILATFLMCFASSVVNLIGIVLENSSNRPDFHFKICSASLIVIFEVAYCLTLLPKEEEYDYGRQLDSDLDSRALGTAECGTVWSKLFFWWFSPLIDKGGKNKLDVVEDLFQLPLALKAYSVFEKISPLLSLRLTPKDLHNPPQRFHHHQNNSSSVSEVNVNGQNLSLFRSLLKCFGVEYFSIGILKLFSDGLSFSGPLLLNVIVSHLETNEASEERNNYFFAFGLFIATILGSFSNTQYNFQIHRTSLKIRAAIITALYSKILSVNKVTLSVYNMGQIINFMSTDTDRIVNFCESFHQFWSLPVQVVIIFCLLHQQVGFSFIVGVAFAAVVIPINQVIAKKIAAYSKLMMDAKDKRIRKMTEIIYGIRTIKTQSWEDFFMEKVEIHRKSEVSFLKKRKYLDAVCVYLWATTPLVIAFLTFTTFVLLGNPLSASKIFTSIALFNMLISPLNAFPWVLNGLMEAWISLKRIEGFFQLSNFDIEKYYTWTKDLNPTVQVSGGIFEHPPCEEHQSSFDSDEFPIRKEFCLGPIDFKIGKGQLICIIGKVGSGKSSVLYSVLGDLIRKQGKVSLQGSIPFQGIGFVSQEPWLMQGTIRSNILFGKPFNKDFYGSVLEACELSMDMLSFPYGDCTEVGENGFTLSGGQRARIAFARAVYQKLDLYLIDEPFASVDINVAKQVFENCILGILRWKTRIICTHHECFAEVADYVIILDDGRVIAQGPPEKVFRSVNLSASQLRKCGKGYSFSSEQQMDTAVDSEQLIQDEERDRGVVKLKVYKSYWNAAGTGLAVFVLLCCFLMQSFRTLSDWWLSFWVSHSNSTIPDVNISGIYSVNIGVEKDSTMFYLYVYGGLVLMNNIFSLARAFSFAYAGLLAATRLHNQLLWGVIKTAVNFFDTTPLGRIMNRFSSDVFKADDTLPFIFNILLAQVFSLIGSLAITCYGLPWVTLLIIPLLLAYYRIQKYYRCTSRELRRLSSVTLSPLYAHLSETLKGHSTIRALAATYRFQKENMDRLDKSDMTLYATMAASQWLNLRLQFIGVVVVTGIAFISLIQNAYSHIDPALVGLALSYALSLTSLLNGTVSAFTETEKELISVERIFQYVENLEAEGNDDLEMPPPSWPSRGTISFSHVYLKYRPNVKCALYDVTFKVNSGEHVGIIGRTGSGKSSLIKALLHMVDIRSGTVCIDDEDVSKLNLKELRSRVSVIPQEPFLFDGTIRENLDPFHRKTDAEILSALQSCHLVDHVNNFGGLYAEVREGGQNLSFGERQLICLARAFLQDCIVLVMDEATSCVDMATDSKIQETIKVAFKDTTAIIVAHRLQSVMDCNRIVVMAEGKVENIWTTSELLENYG